jgi:hypothetical protein
MKYVFITCAGLLLTAAFFSCENWNESDKGNLKDTLTVHDTVLSGFAAYSPEFRLLLENDNSFFRGKELGMSKANVAEPSLEKIEETPNSITYTIQLEATEEADIIYGFSNTDLLSSIDIFFYPKNDSSLQVMKKEMIHYYTTKTGLSVIDKNLKTVLLNTNTNTGIEWTEEGNRKIKDLHMHIFSLSAL